MLTPEQLARLDQAFNPRGVAVIGATTEQHRVGFSVLESLLVGGFEGEIYPIHPRHETILGKRVYPSLAQVGRPVDLAIVALNERATIDILDELGRYDVKAAVCVAGGYSEIGEGGEELQQALADAAARNRVLLVGPNTLGVINARVGLNATFWPERLQTGGEVSVITQSGGVGQMVICKAQEEGLELNKWIGAGNRAVLDFDGLLQYLAEDPTTSVIAAFIEGTDRARSFVELAAEVSREKPVVVMKAGRTAQSQAAALTHTGSMAGSYKVYQDVFAQFRLLSVPNVDSLVSACKALALAPLPRGGGIGMLTPSAGPSILLVDALAELGDSIPPFSQKTLDRIADHFKNVPVVLKNPLDAAAAGYATEGYLALADAILDDPGIHLLVTINLDHKNRRFPAQELVALSRQHAKPIVALFIGHGERVLAYREACQAGGIPFYGSVEEAAWGIHSLVHQGARHLAEGAG
jgi:acetyl-CoA synthetase (ADP-forming)